jgi:outer membrane protein assembly factor BamB
MTNLFIGIKGAVLAIDRASGDVVWNAALKGGDFVNVTMDAGQLYAATRGELFCLDPATGTILWHNRLEGMGTGLVTFAQAADGNLLALQQQRRNEEAVAAGTVAATG